MKKLMFIVAVLFALATHADYLYWMVENPLEVDGKSLDWTSASFFQGETKLSTMTAAQMSFAEHGLANLGTSGYDVATYYIELYNSQSSDPVARAEIPYSMIANNVFGDNSFGAPGLTTFTASASSFHAVPEPTSGLLFLVGGMLLGLRRKRRV